MIQSFRDKETELIWQGIFSLKLPHDIQRIALRKLIMLHKSLNLKDLQIPPSNNLEKLHGDREGQYSIRINDQWRVCFNWHNGNATNVEITDYH
ncbi:MAG: type II toxin-antitoxin system RelE/ParE family toxin [Spirochaetaceae bacterium]|jgi:proteic killer suppression protein|nr:type II toxin-antitoxin system RelE/ParE family toxin [Spirochaetaceae bacterium]